MKFRTEDREYAQWYQDHNKLGKISLKWKDHEIKIKQ